MTSSSQAHAVIGTAHRESAVGGIHDAGIPVGDVRWEGYSHRRMWDMIMRSRPRGLFARADRWRAAADLLVEQNKFLQRKLNTLLATWQGPAAEAAARSQQALLDWAQEAATRASTVGIELGNYGNALVSARMRMPQPQQRAAELAFRDGDGAQVRDGTAGAHLLLQVLSDRLPTEQQAREAKWDAVRIMRELENDAQQAERAMPRFSAAPRTTNDAAPSPTPVPPGAVPAPLPGPAPAPMPGPADVDGVVPATTSAQAFGQPTAAGAGEFRGTLTPPGVGPGSGPGDVVGRGGSPWGAGAGGGAAPGGVLGAPGRGGLPGAGPSGGGAPGGTGGRAAVAGTGGGFVPGAGGAREDGDEDTAKPLADYLEGDDIFTDDRRVSPPVWGA